MSSEQGSVTIVTVAFLAVAVVLVMGVTDVAKVLVARERAQTAADAAALAAAQELALPSGLDPCAVAAGYAQVNGAAVLACEIPASGTEVTVTTISDAGPLLLFIGNATVTSTSRSVLDLP